MSYLEGQWRDLVRLWAMRTGNGAPDLDSNFLSGIGNQHMGWVGAYSDEVYAASAILPAGA